MKDSDPRIREELERIKSDNEEGMLLPESVVAFARNPETALHSRFTWDDGEAAEKYRIWEARQIIATVVVVVSKDHPPYRAYISLSSDRVAGGGYRSLDVVVRSKRMYAEALEDALKELRRLEEKYGHLKELEIVWAAARSLRRRRTATVA